MLRELAQQARRLPGEIERLAKEVSEKKNALHELVLLKEVREAEITRAVVNERNGDGKPAFPNEESRRSEITRRLLQDENWRELKADLDETRQALAEAEAALEKARAEHRTVLALLEVLASGLRGGMALQEIEGLLAEQPSETASKARNGGQDKAHRQAQDTTANGNGTRWATVKVLEARPGKSEGTIRAWCEEVETGEKVAVFAKNSVAEKLAKAIGKRVKVEFKELDAGWFAVKVA